MSPQKRDCKTRWTRQAVHLVVFIAVEALYSTLLFILYYYLYIELLLKKKNEINGKESRVLQIDL